MAKSFPNTGATVIDATADLPGSPSEGMMVFQKDTNELKIYDGASWVSVVDTDTPPGLNKITSGTFAGTTTSVNIPNVFSSAFTNYRLVLSNMNFSAYGDIYFRMLTDTTPYTAANYFWAHRGILSNTNILDNVSSSNTLAYMGLTNTVGGAGAAGNGSYDIFCPFLPAITYITGTGTGITGGTGFSMRTGTMVVDVYTSFNGIQLLTNTATTIGGNYAVYGYVV